MDKINSDEIFNVFQTNKKDLELNVKVFFSVIQVDYYTINEDLTVDVNGDLDLSDHYFDDGFLPFKFNNIYGDFNVSNTRLDTCYNFPEYVVGNIDLSLNFINDLEALRGITKKFGTMTADNFVIDNIVTDEKKQKESDDLLEVKRLENKRIQFLSQIEFLERELTTFENGLDELDKEIYALKIKKSLSTFVGDNKIIY